MEYKRGSPYRPDEPLRRPEALQFYAQVALLRRHGYAVPRAEIWFDATRQRVPIDLPADLEGQVAGAVAEIRDNAAREVAPPPLLDDPKCPHCVLVGLCLPDEMAAIRTQTAASRMLVPDSPAHPLYLTEPDTVLGRAGGRLTLRRRGEVLRSARVLDVSHVVVYGNATVTAAAIREIAEHGGTVIWCSFLGWPMAVAGPVRKADARRRIAQHRTHLVGSPSICRSFTLGKLRNQRTLLRRLGGEPARAAIAAMTTSIDALKSALDVPSTLGHEGAAGRVYFKAFPTMLRRPLGTFDFEGRNRRPPRDPINALLSFSYALLARATPPSHCSRPAWIPMSASITNPGSRGPRLPSISWRSSAPSWPTPR